MINRHTTRTLDTFTRFSWRFWIVIGCTTWLCMYQMLQWHAAVRARDKHAQQIMQSGMPPILLIYPAPADAPTRVAPACSHVEFAGPTEYFRYMDTRMRDRSQNTRNNRFRTR